MKLSVNEIEYEISEECIGNVVTAFVSAVTAKSKLPPELEKALLNLHSLNEEELTILLNNAREYIMSIYSAMSTPKKIAIMTVSRLFITHVDMKFNNTAISAIIRPERKKDPTEHLINIFYKILMSSANNICGRINNATIEVTTQRNTVTHANVAPSATRATLDFNGYDG